MAGKLNHIGSLLVADGLNMGCMNHACVGR